MKTQELNPNIAGSIVSRPWIMGAFMASLMVEMKLDHRRDDTTIPPTISTNASA